MNGLRIRLASDGDRHPGGGEVDRDAEQIGARMRSPGFGCRRESSRQHDDERQHPEVLGQRAQRQPQIGRPAHGGRNQVEAAADQGCDGQRDDRGGGDRRQLRSAARSNTARSATRSGCWRLESPAQLAGRLRSFPAPAAAAGEIRDSPVRRSRGVCQPRCVSRKPASTTARPANCITLGISPKAIHPISSTQGGTSEGNTDARPAPSSSTERVNK